MGAAGSTAFACVSSPRAVRVFPQYSCEGEVRTVAGDGNEPGYRLGPAAAAARFDGIHAIVGGLNTPGEDKTTALAVLDTKNHRVCRIMSGECRTIAGGGGFLASGGFADAAGGRASFNEPCGVTIDREGTLLIADTANNRVRAVAPGPLGQVTTFAGNGQAGGIDGPATAAATFDGPCGIVAAPDGSVFVSESRGLRIRVLSPDRVVSTLAGGSRGNADGTGEQAQFCHPKGLALCPDGSLVLADSEGHRIRRVDRCGVTTTVAGSRKGYRDGPLATARFSSPQDVAVASDGVIYIADSGNARIRQICPLTGIVSTLAGSGKQACSDASGVAAAFRRPVALHLDEPRRGLYVGEEAAVRAVTVSTARDRRTTPRFMFLGLRILLAQARANLRVARPNDARENQHVLHQAIDFLLVQCSDDVFEYVMRFVS